MRNGHSFANIRSKIVFLVPMSTRSQNSRIIFGLKVKQLRQELKLSFSDLAKATEMSVSYLNEIEKGKKFPKEDKIIRLSQALGVSPEELTSEKLEKNLAPLSELLRSNFLSELPLDLFGIELSKVVEIIANAPVRVGAFISTLLELSRNYALNEESFYFGALRSYLELHSNYFEEIEKTVDKFNILYNVPINRPLNQDILRKILEDRFGYSIINNGLDNYPELQSLRSVFIPQKKQLLLNSDLSPVQLAFQYGKEIGFNILGLKERANTSSLLNVRTFEEVLNHSKAIYFSVALHIRLQSIVEDMTHFFAMKKWDGDAFLAIMKKYEATPEMFYHRLTNILPYYFGMHQLFFLRFLHNPVRDSFSIDKELHLSHRHQPHGNALSEHYCRRWVSVSLLHNLRQLQLEGHSFDTIVGIQRSHYHGTDSEYLCLTLARPDYPLPDRNVSVTLGLLINQNVREKIGFINDREIQIREVNTTCERCPMVDCEERAVAPKVIEKKEKWQNIQRTLTKLAE